jgi:hypothetical protein
VIVRKEWDCSSGQAQIAGTKLPIRLGVGAYFAGFVLFDDGALTTLVVVTATTTLLISRPVDYRIFAAPHSELAKDRWGGGIPQDRPFVGSGERSVTKGWRRFATRSRLLITIG